MSAPDEAWFDPTDRCWCGGHSTQASEFSPHYLVCPRCGAHFSRRRLRADAVAKFYSYQGYWHDRQTTKQHPSLVERRAMLERDGRVEQWTRAILRHHGEKPGRAVEVGCAEGSLLLRLRSLGWTVTGVEPDAETARRVTADTQLPVVAGSFPETAVPECDVFIACDVLEHAIDPQAFVRGAWRALRAEGIAFFQLPLIQLAPQVPDFAHYNDKVFDPWEHTFIHTRDSVVTLLETCGFEVLENSEAWMRAHEFVVARKRIAPVRAVRHIANLGEMFSPEWTSFMDELNAFARPLGLREFTNWAKLWEYPALWRQGLSGVDWSQAHLVDLGSEASPLPWFLATRGARVTLIETRDNWVGQWTAIREKLGVKVDWHIVNSCDLPLPTASCDVVTSLSVIEHQDDQRRAVAEAARVLKPGGIFALSFDICEADLGMTFPAWNGRALTMAEFESIVWRNPAFDPGRPLEWNREDIPSFLRWHRQTAAHHNYVTGAALLRKKKAGLLAALARLFR